MCMSMKNGRGTMKPSSRGVLWDRITMGKCEHSDDRFDSFCCSAKTPNSQHCNPEVSHLPFASGQAGLVHTRMSSGDGKSMQDTGKSHYIGKQTLLPNESI